MSTTKREKVIENLIRVLNGKEPLPVANIPKGLKPLNELSQKLYNGSLNLDNKFSSLPKVFLNGDVTSMTKEVAVPLQVDYENGNDSFSCWAKVKWQGTSSISFPKKNYTVTFYKKSDLNKKEKVDFGKGWGKQSKYCMKANYVDHTHARNIVSARIASELYKESLPVSTPNNGLIDGFPIEVYLNGRYEGVYTLNIPKDGWMFGMNEDNPNHCVLCAEQYGNKCFFKELADIDGTDWSVEFPDAISDNLKTSFNNLITFVKDSTDEEFKANIEDYFNLEHLLVYYCFMHFSCASDNIAKNMLMATWDGQHWYPCLYDMDATWGLYWDGSKLNDYTYETGFTKSSSLLWTRLRTLFAQEICDKYLELRQGALSNANVLEKFNQFMNEIGKNRYEEDLTSYPNIPGTTYMLRQIESFIDKRSALIDQKLLIQFSQNYDVIEEGYTYKFNNLTAKAPDIEYSSNDKEIATIDDNGVVTGIKPGIATINMRKMRANISTILLVAPNPVKENDYLSFSLSGDIFWTTPGESSSLDENYIAFTTQYYPGKNMWDTIPVTPTTLNEGQFICDKLTVVSHADFLTHEGSCITITKYSETGHRYIIVKLLKADYPGITDVTTFQKYLRNNPINLKVKTTSTIKSFILNEDNITNLKLDSTEQLTRTYSFNADVELPSTIDNTKMFSATVDFQSDFKSGPCYKAIVASRDSDNNVKFTFRLCELGRFNDIKNVIKNGIRCYYIE